MVRRFLVGLPEYTIHDAMAGRTLERVTAAESVAEKGDVMLDAATVKHLETELTIDEWRIHPDTQERFAVITALDTLAQEEPWEKVEDSIQEKTIRNWILPSVYDRIWGATGT